MERILITPLTDGRCHTLRKGLAKLMTSQSPEKSFGQHLLAEAPSSPTFNWAFFFPPLLKGRNSVNPAAKYCKVRWELAVVGDNTFPFGFSVKFLA